MKRLLAVLPLLVALNACNIAVDVAAVIRPGGDGHFHVSFAFDKEFVSVVSSSPEGKRSLRALQALGSSKTASGWSISSSSANGGLAITIDRMFAHPQELNAALEQIASRPQQGSLAFLNIFRNFRIQQSRGFPKTITDVNGEVDLAPERLAPQFANAKRDLRQALQKAASKVFSFHVAVWMPGRITHYAGSPTQIDGSRIEWTAAFGERLAFGAHASYLRWSNIALAAAPVFLLLLAGAALMIRTSRTRAAPVQGWEVEPVATKGESS